MSGRAAQAMNGPPLTGEQLVSDPLNERRDVAWHLGASTGLPSTAKGIRHGSLDSRSFSVPLTRSGKYCRNLPTGYPESGQGKHSRWRAIYCEKLSKGCVV